MEVRIIEWKPGKASACASCLKERRNTIIKIVTIRCLQVVCDYTPWFQKEGTLDEKAWGRVRKNIEKTQ